MQNQPTSRFPRLQDIYFKVTWLMLIISIALAVISYLLVQAIVAAPLPLVYFALYFLYYHAFHFLYGMMSLFYYFAKVKKKIGKTKIYKTVLGLLISPASAIIAYTAVFLLAVSSCTSS